MEKHIKHQLEISYNGKLNELFKEWRESYLGESDTEYRFCEDGLVLKNNDTSSNFDINKEWENSSRKIMFLLKDCPDEYGYDIRTILTGYKDNKDSLVRAENNRTLKGRFFINLAKILYGLTYMTKQYLGNELSQDIQNKSKLIHEFNVIPFAYVECKKLAGGKTCNNTILKSVMEKDKKFLIRELNILSPNIIVCCGGGDCIFNFVVENFFDGLVPDDDDKWEYDYVLEDGTNCGFRCKMYYYRDKGILLFNSYHPAAFYGWKISERVLSPFRQFFNRYGTFDVVADFKTTK